MIYMLILLLCPILLNLYTSPFIKKDIISHFLGFFLFVKNIYIFTISCMKCLWSILFVISILLWNILYIFQDSWFFNKQFILLGSYDRQLTVMEEAKELMVYWYDDKKFVDRDIYTDAEEEHLYDVKKILCLIFFIFLAVILWWLLCSFFLWWKESTIVEFFLAVKITLLCFVFFALILCAMAWVSWDWLFDSFHRLFFVDNRSFSSENFLIQSYPWEFFRNAMIAVLVRSLVIFLSCLLAVFAVSRLRR